jgi:hypothetical protein
VGVQSLLQPLLATCLRRPHLGSYHTAHTHTRTRLACAVWNPLSWAMEVAALLAIILLDYADFAMVGARVPRGWWWCVCVGGGAGGVLHGRLTLQMASCCDTVVSAVLCGSSVPQLRGGCARACMPIEPGRLQSLLVHTQHTHRLWRCCCSTRPSATWRRPTQTRQSRRSRVRSRQSARWVGVGGVASARVLVHICMRMAAVLELNSHRITCPPLTTNHLVHTPPATGAA